MRNLKIDEVPHRLWEFRSEKIPETREFTSGGIPVPHDTIGPSDGRSFAALIENVQATRIKIEDFMDLPQGWCHGEGIPIKKEAVRLANNVINIAMQNHLLTDAVPSLEGGIQVAIYAHFKDNDKYVEVTLENNNAINYSRYDKIAREWKITTDVVLCSLDDFRKQIERFLGDVYQWHVTSGYYRKDTTTVISEGFQVKHSGITEVPYHWLRKYASQNVIVSYASI